MIIGRRINGRYKVVRMIGGGGMATVYLARDMILDRDVAMKILRLDFSNDEEFIRRFHREAQAATSLTHPNIVSIYDVGEEEDIYYIVMEFVDGMTLKQYIQSNPSIPIETAISIMKQITSAISHAHQNHIVHRDIKPHNILVDNKGTVKITDFGIAMALSATSITQTNAVLGSVHYLSPEQARGGTANKKSDIYSLGIVMFEILTGRLPFSGESAVSIALKHLQTDTPSPKRWNPDVPQSVENIVLKATAKDPFHRYNSVEEMEEDLATVLNDERLDEPKFVIPDDNEATKAIPIITNDLLFKNKEETIIRGEDDTKIAPPIGDGKAANSTTDKNKKTNKKKNWKLIIGGAVALLALLIIFSITVLPDLLGAKEVKVPDVREEELEDAISLLVESGFNVGEKIELEDEEIAEGRVIKTDPKHGKTVKEGSTIDIYYSIGKEKAEVQEYLERNYEDNQALINKFGFKNVEITERHDESTVGTILEQKPDAGEMVIPSETILELVISKGPEKVTVKNLTGYNQTALDDYAKDANLNITIAGEENSDTIEAGSVIWQKPAASTQVEKGSTISVTISKGKKEIPPKTVTKEVTITYDESAGGAPQEVLIYINDMNHNMTEPVESFFITETIKKKLTFTIPYNDKAGYRIIKDNSIFDDGVINYTDS